MKYVKKPDVVEAFQLLKETVFKDLPGWINFHWVGDEIPVGYLKLQEFGALLGTESGPVRVRWNDFLMQGKIDPTTFMPTVVPCRALDFLDNYEPVK